ncbi:MAG: hypothetical protein ACTSRS_11145 [Candidatus Helarchaeota archaeon]
MRIAVLYEKKFEDTKGFAEFLVHQIGSNGHEVQIFYIKETKPKDTLDFNPEALMIVTPTHSCKWPCLFKKTANYIKQMGKNIKKGTITNLKRIAVFNCNEPENYTCKIKKKIRKMFPYTELFCFPTFKINYYKIFNFKFD